MRTNPRAKKKPWGKKKSLSWERAIVCAQGQKKLAEQRGSPTCWASPERVLFLLLGLSKLPASSVPGSEPPQGRSGRTPRLGSHCGSLPGAGTDLLGKYRSFDNSCLTSLLGFFPYTLRKRNCPSLCPQIQTLFFCGGLHGNRYLFLIPTCGIIHF